MSTQPVDALAASQQGHDQVRQLLATISALPDNAQPVTRHLLLKELVKSACQVLYQDHAILFPVAAEFIDKERMQRMQWHRKRALKAAEAADSACNDWIEGKVSHLKPFPTDFKARVLKAMQPWLDYAKEVEDVLLPVLQQSLTEGQRTCLGIHYHAAATVVPIRPHPSELLHPLHRHERDCRWTRTSDNVDAMLTYPMIFPSGSASLQQPVPVKRETAKLNTSDVEPSDTQAAQDIQRSKRTKLQDEQPGTTKEASTAVGL